MGRFLGIPVKKVARCRCLNGHVKEPYEMSMAWEPDRRFNFFSPPAHLCTVTYVTEISLHVTLGNQSHSLTLNLSEVDGSVLSLFIRMPLCVSKSLAVYVS